MRREKGPALVAIGRHGHRHAMRVVCMCCFRNEADIIEPFIRHTAVYCDQLVLLDHGSTDASAEIVQQLQGEGLPIHLLRDFQLGSVEADQNTRLLKVAVEEFSADWIFCLDADEFIVGPIDRSFLPIDPERRERCLRIRSRDYYPAKEDSPEVVNPVERITHRADPFEPESPNNFKVVVPGELARREAAFLAQGKHNFFIDAHEEPMDTLQDVLLAHFSIRSAPQYAMKLAAKQLQKFRHIAPQGDDLSYYDAPYARLRDSYSDFVRGFASERLAYKSPECTSKQLIHDPIVYRGGPLRYTRAPAGADDFVRELLNLAERLARTPQSPDGANGAPRCLALEVTDDRGGRTATAHFDTRAPGFRSLSVACECSEEATELRLVFRTDPAIVEISEITLCDKDAVSGRVFRATELQNMLSILSGGAAIAPTDDAYRLVASKDLVRAVFAGWKDKLRGAPVKLLLRMRVEQNLIVPTLTSPAVLSQIVQEQTELRVVRAALAALPKGAQRRPYRLGSKIDFTSEGNSSQFVGEGWSVAEPWGRWTEADCARLHIHFERRPERALRLNALLHAFVHGDHREIVVRVCVGQREVGTWRIDSPDPSPRHAEIPPEAFDDRDCEIVFLLETAVSPAELGFSSDPRRLGAGFVSVDLQYAEAAPA